MRKSKFSDSQILAVLKQAENGASVADICEEHGIGQATFYKWRAKFASNTKGSKKAKATVEKAEKSEKAVAVVEKADKVEKAEKADKPAKADKSAKAAKAEKAEKAAPAPTPKQRDLEDENRLLKKMYAEAQLTVEMLKEALAKKK